ncbi:hypothetical protein [Cognatishimia sp.]|uniref:hypothetical protein n=1 Tax=Cognatishimia sp. TaxID=2211648 RepID=UPI003511C008
MLRLILAGLGTFAALGGAAIVVLNLMAPSEPVEVASLDPSAGLIETEERSAVSKIIGVLPFIDNEPPITRGRALADRDALRRQELTSFMPEAPEGWERIEWDAFFAGIFGDPDNLENVEKETVVYLNGGKSIYLRIENASPTGPMVADLLQMQRYVEKGGDLSDLEAYRATVGHTIETVRSTSDGWSVGSKMKFGYFNIVQGVSFIIGKDASKPTDFPDMRFYHGALGGGVVIKLRSEAPTADIMAILEGIDFDSLNQMQEVPNPLVGEGLPEFVLETPEQWLHNRGFKLRKVERVIPVKEVPEEEDIASAEDAKDGDVIAKGDDKKKKDK